MHSEVAVVQFFLESKIFQTMHYDFFYCFNLISSTYVSNNNSSLTVGFQLIGKETKLFLPMGLILGRFLQRNKGSEV